MTTTEADALDRADMRRLAAGEESALNPLMQRHAPAIFRFLVRQVGNEDDANDLAQETFVRVHRARDDFRGEAKFTTWLFTIAANLARNHHRWRVRHPNVSLEAGPETGESSLADTLPDQRPSPRQAADLAERAAVVREAVQRLPEDLRESLVLCEWEELSVAEAAAVLETTPKAVEARLYRARRLLRERLVKWL